MGERERQKCVLYVECVLYSEVQGQGDRVREKEWARAQMKYSTYYPPYTHVI